MRRESVVYSKAKSFAVRIVKLGRYLNEDMKEYILSRQIVRSGTSIGANIAEAMCGCSEKDFLNKAYISFKECGETIYWLELLKEGEYISRDQFDSLHADAIELHKMLSSITKTLREKLNSRLLTPNSSLLTPN